MLLIGTPVNPVKIIEAYIEINSLEIVEHNTRNGGFLVAMPLVANFEKLRRKAWTKLLNFIKD